MLAALVAAAADGEAEGDCQPGLGGGKFLFGGVAGKNSQLKHDGEDHRGGSGTGRDKVVPFAPFLLVTAKLALGFHLLDAPFGFAGISRGLAATGPPR